jgi:hypothetical protein
MATGWPMKTTYANGDVYSAGDVNDITGTINLLGSSVALTAGKNIALNGAAQIWQRGTSVTGSTSAFCADRFQAYRNTTGSTFSRQATSDTTNLPFIQYCIRAQRNNGDTATNAIWVSQTLESVNSIPMAGKAVTLSFYARRGANFSSASNVLSVVLGSGTGTDQNIFAGFTGNVNVVNSSATLTTTWQRFTFTGTVPATSTQLAFYTVYNPVGTAGAADFYEITGMQLEQGSTATAFQTATGNYQAELAACQRYFWQIATGSGTSFSLASAESTNTPLTVLQAPVTMRIAPSLVQTTGSAYYVIRSNAGINTFSTFITDNNSVNGITIYATSATITAGNAGRFITNNASSSLALNSEI